MKVFKFGGASLKDAVGIKNVASIIQSTPEKLIVVVSAMGKTTDGLERVFQNKNLGRDYKSELNQLKDYHNIHLKQLVPDGHQAYKDIEAAFKTLENQLLRSGEEDEVYDQVVSMGEILSSIIVNHYCQHIGANTSWLDARSLISTDNCFREGKVNWQQTAANMKDFYKKVNTTTWITQGFIGKTDDGLTTTLGREGSDYTAAIFGSQLDAESVTIWKDVPGVMSADPKRIPDAVVFSELPFKEAAEMTYYGASVIHPKTIKPLANRGIPLLVKNFTDPSLPGTLIHECKVTNLPPLIVFKGNQCLVSCKVTDYTFVNEEQMGIIFNALSALDIHINVMQNSAISFSFCIDFRENKIKALIERLQQYFEVYYNTGLTLITIKNYDEATFEKYRRSSGVLMQQSSRSTLQVLVKL